MKLVFLFLLLFQNVFSQDYDFSGIKLKSKNFPFLERSSVSLTEAGPIKLENHFSVSFDISFWSLNYFGPIFQAYNNESELAKLVFNQFHDNDYYLIQLYVGKLFDPLLIKLDKKNFYINKWINIKIEFNLKANSVLLYLNKNLIAETNYKLPDKVNLNAFFGLVDLSNRLNHDLAAVYLKNILIEENHEKKHFWPLNPYDNSCSLDKIGRRKISLTNTDWLVNDHYYWYKKHEIEVNNFPLFAYDSIRSRVFIDDKTRLIILDLLNMKDSVIVYKNSRPGTYHKLLYDYLRNRLYSTYSALGQVSIYDFNLNEWSPIDTSTEKDGLYFGNADFINPFDSSIYAYGGYGWYTAHDKLLRYDFNNKEWKEVNVKNKIGPRFNMSVGSGFEQIQLLFWNGEGNESGRQEEGFINYPELYSFDLIKKDFVKLWSYKNADEFKNYTHNYLYFYLDKKDSSFYFMRDYHDSLKVFLHLFKAEMNKNKITRVGQELLRAYNKEGNNSFLCFNTITREVIVVKKNFEDRKVVIYALRYPPIPKELLPPHITSTSSESYFTFILIGIAFSLLSAFVYLYYRNKRTKNNKEAESPTINSENKVKTNYIKTFGGLNVLNNQGEDIFQQLSPKLKEIFLLILFRSVLKRNGGISSEELSATIWPDSSPESAKSNRGVAISKIRKTLSSAEGIDLKFRNNLWLVNLDNGAKCDYLEFLKIREGIKGSGTNSNLIQLCLDKLHEGEFLKGISYEWLDSYKLAVNNEIIGFLKEFLNGKSEQLKNGDRLKLKVSDIILKFDSVDEEAFKFKIRTYYKSGNHQLAKRTYKVFIAEYKHLYDEEYPLSLQEIVFPK